MYVTAQEVRDRVKLLSASSISDAEIERFIIDAEAQINIWLAPLYIVPVIPVTYPTGTISVSASSTTVTGTSTLFVTDRVFWKYDHIRIVDSNEVAIISAIASNTSATVTANINTTANNSQFFVIPEEVCAATRYLAGKLILEWKFNEQAFNQNTDQASQRYQEFGEKILNAIQKGKYFNANLQTQVSTKTPARAITIYDSDNQSNVSDTIEEIASWWT